MKRKALVVGGNSGVGLSVVIDLLDRGYDHIYIVGKEAPVGTEISERFRPMFNEKTSFARVNLLQEDYSIFDSIQDIDTLFISAGFGRVAPFEELTEPEITNLVKCNELAIIHIIKKYYKRMRSEDDFYTGIMVSIAGHIVSPLFAVYGAAKMGLRGFIENINTELAAVGTVNRILDISPGSLKGTRFNGGENSLDQMLVYANNFVNQMLSRALLYIPDYEEIFKNVMERYNSDYMKYGIESWEYKAKSGRRQMRPQVTVGYLSGTFDLFHIGHLNLLKRAKEECDYLIVGVHESGAWKGKETYISFEERKEIVGSCKFVDKVIKSYPEDCDAWKEFHYDKLFVGSDYKGTERFLKYEEYFGDKGVEIIYFPYTKGTSSSQLRTALKKQQILKQSHI